MMRVTIAEQEIGRISWSQLLDSSGSAANMPVALLKLINAATAEQVQIAYWQLENFVVVQGQLFEVAEYVVPVLMASLLDNRPRYVKIGVLELLLQIVSGQPDEDEIVSNNKTLSEKCKRKAQEGMWLLYKELSSGEKNAAREVLEQLDPDKTRLSHYSHI